MNRSQKTAVAEWIAKVTVGLNARLQRSTVLLGRETWKEAITDRGSPVKRLERKMARVAHLDDSDDCVDATVLQSGHSEYTV